MDENESLKSSLVEARQRLEHVQSFEVLSQGQVDKDLIRSDSDPFEESPLNNTQIASFSLTPPPNIMNAQYEMSMRKIIFLEKEAMRCAQLQEQVRQLEKALQVLTTQYNELLEVDGERLERIEELEQDVIDLRQLMKEQGTCWPWPCGVYYHMQFFTLFSNPWPRFPAGFCMAKTCSPAVAAVAGSQHSLKRIPPLLQGEGTLTPPKMRGFVTFVNCAVRHCNQRGHQIRKSRI
ncbi:hypothetical protein Y032_0210g2139 [Ancylostoma ceylanicum]|uniref:TATA element modulatory factor 1 TATA binding domain-containing protein n=1 Tax=Ancylostoma ceylanicum TaxID=53326 RepID=A0A016SLA4_9BILA|nr:hypothetical protein Y032_0210g2139 [Ancylostoma ceylanicum]